MRNSHETPVGLAGWFNRSVRFAGIGTQNFGRCRQTIPLENSSNKRPIIFFTNSVADRPTGRYDGGMNQVENFDTPSRILDSVMQLILHGGLPAVTLSAVCRQAQLSKGGLIHHYPTKEVLVAAFVQRAVDQYLAMINEVFDQHPGGQGRRATAFVDLFLGDPTAFEPGANRDCTAVMLALIQGRGRNLLARNLYGEVLPRLRRDGLSMEVAETIVAAIDGLWLQSMIEPIEVVLPRAAHVRRQLRKLIHREISRVRMKHQEKNQS